MAPLQPHENNFVNINNDDDSEGPPPLDGDDSSDNDSDGVRDNRGFRPVFSDDESDVPPLVGRPTDDSSLDDSDAVPLSNNEDDEDEDVGDDDDNNNNNIQPVEFVGGLLEIVSGLRIADDDVATDTLADGTSENNGNVGVATFRYPNDNGTFTANTTASSTHQSLPLQVLRRSNTTIITKRGGYDKYNSHQDSSGILVALQCDTNSDSAEGGATSAGDSIATPNDVPALEGYW